MVELLVVGGDSLIGSALASRFARRAMRVSATTRRRERASPDRPLLDLSNPSDWPDVRADVAVLCAAETSIARCEAGEAGVARVNVEGLAEIARRLAAAGSFIVLPSSTMVFDGELPGRKPSDPVSPRTAYGRQKVMLEQRLRELSAGGHAIVRIGKVVSPQVPLFAGWLDRLRAGMPIRAFTDLAISPVAIDRVAELLERIVERRLAGTFHFTAADAVSYEEAGAALAAALGADPSLVEPTPRPEPAFAQRYPALDCEATAQRLGVTIPQALEAMRDLARSPAIAT